MNTVGSVADYSWTVIIVRPSDSAAPWVQDRKPLPNDHAAENIMVLREAHTPEPPGDMFWRRAYAGTPDKARQAREFVEQLLADFAGVDDAVQAAAELAANALAHSRSGAPGGIFVVEVRRWRECAAVTVTDQGGRTAPSLGAPDDDDECGRGLCLVDALASWWGWRGGDLGRTVTAIFHGRS